MWSEVVRIFLTVESRGEFAMKTMRFTRGQTTVCNVLKNKAVRFDAAVKRVRSQAANEFVIAGRA